MRSFIACQLNCFTLEILDIEITCFIVSLYPNFIIYMFFLRNVMKFADPRQQKRPEGSGPRNSGYDLSAHSGSSTPSSQAPMTA